MSRYSEHDIQTALGRVPAWKREGDAIVRTFDCANFDGSIAFTNEVARLANAANHHPDIAIAWNDVTLTLSSHDAGGLTQRDFDLAQQIDAIAPATR
jgi:4a-hydroxytetrahydrobiopterin dehydratase